MVGSKGEHTQQLALKRAREFQERSLARVSRTFALVIPQLPTELREPVGAAYLVCRLLDTIEDDPGIAENAKTAFQTAAIELLEDSSNAAVFSRELGARLGPETSEAERELVANLDSVLRVHGTLTRAQRVALRRCAAIMADGMARFERGKGIAGLEDDRALDDYCFVVAGVVGEMLTELFCSYAPDIATRREPMLEKARSFGQALQMTNILKDVRGDLARGVSWLPRDRFRRHGVELATLTQGLTPPGFSPAYLECIAIAHRHGRVALDYIAEIPARHHGIRLFCLWSLAMAFSTLERLAEGHANVLSQDAKISRGQVKRLYALSWLVARSPALQRPAFSLLGRRLPSP